MLPARDGHAEFWFVRQPTRHRLSGAIVALGLVLLAVGAGVIALMVLVAPSAGAAGGCGGA